MAMPLCAASASVPFSLIAPQEFAKTSTRLRTGKIGFTQRLSSGDIGLTQQPPPGTFAERLTRARKLTGASRPEVAAAAGVSHYTVGTWERGDEANPSMAALIGMSALLGVSIDWLAHGSAIAG